MGFGGGDKPNNLTRQQKGGLEMEVKGLGGPKLKDITANRRV